jgi:hypothetical protein
VQNCGLGIFNHNLEPQLAKLDNNNLENHESLQIQSVINFVSCPLCQSEQPLDDRSQVVAALFRVSISSQHLLIILSESCSVCLRRHQLGLMAILSFKV